MTKHITTLLLLFVTTIASAQVDSILVDSLAVDSLRMEIVLYDTSSSYSSLAKVASGLPKLPSFILISENIFLTYAPPAAAKTSTRQINTLSNALRFLF